MYNIYKIYIDVDTWYIYIHTCAHIYAFMHTHIPIYEGIDEYILICVYMKLNSKNYKSK